VAPIVPIDSPLASRSPRVLFSSERRQTLSASGWSSTNIAANSVRSATNVRRDDVLKLRFGGLWVHRQLDTNMPVTMSRMVSNMESLPLIFLMSVGIQPPFNSW
jgi:hypothetical protein